MNPIDKIIQETSNNMLDQIIIPEYPCRRCKEGYSFSQFSFCDECIEEMVEED